MRMSQRAPWSSWPCDPLDKTKKEVTEKRSLGFDELDHQRSQEQHPDLVAPVVEGTHLMRRSRAVTLPEVSPRNEAARSQKDVEDPKL